MSSVNLRLGFQGKITHEIHSYPTKNQWFLTMCIYIILCNIRSKPKKKTNPPTSSRPSKILDDVCCDWTEWAWWFSYVLLRVPVVLCTPKTKKQKNIHKGISGIQTYPNHQFFLFSLADWCNINGTKTKQTYGSSLLSLNEFYWGVCQKHLCRRTWI